MSAAMAFALMVKKVALQIAAVLRASQSSSARAQEADGTSAEALAPGGMWIIAYRSAKRSANAEMALIAQPDLNAVFLEKKAKQASASGFRAKTISIRREQALSTPQSPEQEKQRALP
jgi:hypothetical protein